MRPSTTEKMLKADAISVDKQFWATISLLETTTDRRVREMWEEDLREIWKRAHHLAETHRLDGVLLPKMKIITSRTVEGWVVLAKSKNAAFTNYF